MEVKKLGEYGKGDMGSFEIPLECSLTNVESVTISLWKIRDLWKKKKYKLQVAHDDGKEFKNLYPRKDPKDKKEAYEWYEKACDDNPGCSPYPEAKAYYERKGLLKPSP